MMPIYLPYNTTHLFHTPQSHHCSGTHIQQYLKVFLQEFLLLVIAMGIVRTDERRRLEIDEFCRMLLSCAGFRKAKDEQEVRNRPATARDNYEGLDQKLVCVTSGVSFLGIAIVNRLLLRGYCVRVIVDNEEDKERLREMELSGEMRGTNNLVGVVLAKLNEPRTLLEAFNGCFAVFHTSAFIDPSGLSGYSKSMVEIEGRAAENVAEACATTESVRNCVLTSSLLTCIWRENSLGNLSPVIDDDCWSDEHFCSDKKLWYALAKLRAEKAAWKIAEERGLNLATICPGLITGPEFMRRSPTPTIAYLKGAQEMFANGLLATVDVTRLAEAHVSIFEEMNKTLSGRYICFDQVVRSDNELRKLAQETGMHINMLFSDNEPSNILARFELSNRKLSRLISTTHRCVSETQF